ncbi:hypothetical protein A6C57_01090 [Fibrella sp. ES10-3-2-2]|nr:hypothetical protein A6C57_01090 [Fibrella sp. ES10-3-2-2]
MNHQTEMTGTDLAMYILGLPETLDQQDRSRHGQLVYDFHYEGLANARAQLQYTRSVNPDYPAPAFQMPSGKYKDTKYLLTIEGSAPNAEAAKVAKQAPSYVITGWFGLGGRVDFDAAKFEFKEINKNVIFNDVVFDCNVELNCLISLRNIEFNRCVFKKGFYINRSIIKKISFNNCSFNSCYLSLYNDDVEEIIVKDCGEVQFSVRIDVEEEYTTNYTNDFSHRIGTLRLLGGRVDGLSLTGKNISNFIIDSTLGNLWVIDIKTNNLNIKSKSIDRTHFSSINIDWLGQEKDTVSTIENISADNCLISGHIRKSTLVISNSSFKVLSIKDFINESNFRIIESKIEDAGSVEIIRAQMGKAEFNTLDLSKATQLQIFSSNITDLITHDVRFPEHILTKYSDDYEGIRAIHRQLKNAASKQGDRVNELRHEKNELQTLMTILKNNKNLDHILLSLNKLTSNHGQDWVTAGCWLFGLGVVFFSSIRFLLGYRYFDINAIPENIASLLTFINPIHRYESIFNNKGGTLLLLGSALFLDNFFRLISSYLLFQFIRATRKYFR